MFFPELRKWLLAGCAEDKKPADLNLRCPVCWDDKAHLLPQAAVATDPRLAPTAEEAEERARERLVILSCGHCLCSPCFAFLHPPPADTQEPLPGGRASRLACTLGCGEAAAAPCGCDATGRCGCSGLQLPVLLARRCSPVEAAAGVPPTRPERLRAGQTTTAPCSVCLPELDAQFWLALGQVAREAAQSAANPPASLDGPEKDAYQVGVAERFLQEMTEKVESVRLRVPWPCHPRVD